MQNIAMNQSLPPKLARRLLHEDVADRLRDRIIQGELAPGSRLNERVLCEELQISRTPLREAFKTLASEGLVTLHPDRGASVTPITADSVRHTFEVLGALESLAGELACRNITDAQLAEIRALHYEMLAHHARRELAGYFRYNQLIHIHIVEASGNPMLAQTYRNLNTHVRRARYMANLSSERWDQAVAEHEAMLTALSQKDSATLQRLLREHLSHKMLAVLEALLQEENIA